MARMWKSAAGCLLCACALGCPRESVGTVARKSNLPLFTTADSAVLRTPEGRVHDGRLIGAYALNDSTIAVVSTAPGGVALVHRTGRPIGLLQSFRGMRPAYVAPCTRGGIVIITEGDRRAIPLSAAGIASDGWRIPSSLGTIHGVQCESGRDLVALVDGTL
ncbi:MAG: hypothetical protein ABI877_05555, partial [Gemmatimonadaceae bacterium]